jgi:hypothetical protein
VHTCTILTNNHSSFTVAAHLSIFNCKAENIGLRRRLLGWRWAVTARVRAEQLCDLRSSHLSHERGDLGAVHLATSKRRWAVTARAPARQIYNPRFTVYHTNEVTSEAYTLLSPNADGLSPPADASNNPMKLVSSPRCQERGGLGGLRTLLPRTQIVRLRSVEAALRNRSGPFRSIK